MKASGRRRSSQPAPGTIERLKKLLSTSNAGRKLVSPEECLARRQVKVLTRALSTDKLSRMATSYGMEVSIRRVQSAGVLSSFSLSSEPFSSPPTADPLLDSVFRVGEHSEQTSPSHLSTLDSGPAEQPPGAAPVTADFSPFFPSSGEGIKGKLRGSEDVSAEGLSESSSEIKNDGPSKSSPQKGQHTSCPSTPSDPINALQLPSPNSPAMRSIVMDAPTPTTTVTKEQPIIAEAYDEDESEHLRRSSLLLIQLDEIVGEMTVAAGSHPLAHHLSEIHRRLSVLSAISDPSREQLPPPLAPRSILSLHREYLTLRKDSEIETDAQELGQLFYEIDGALQGIMDHWEGSAPISLSDSDDEEREQEWESIEYKDDGEDQVREEEQGGKVSRDEAEPLEDTRLTQYPSNDEQQLEMGVDDNAASFVAHSSSLLGDEEAAVMPKELPSPSQGGKMMVRDLSHELVRCSRSIEAIASPKHQEERVKAQGSVQDGITSPICAIPPEPTSHLRCPEFTDYGFIQRIRGCEEGLTNEVDPQQRTGGKENALLKTSTRNDHNTRTSRASSLTKNIHDNYRTCMRHRSTSLHVTAAELDELLEKYFSCIDFGNGNSSAEDPKSLCLVPLNDASLPRWIYPGSRVRVGRHAPWLQAKSMVISRNHCELFHDIDSFYVVDVGSTSGTFLNGNRLSEAGFKGQPVALRSGDILQLGIDCEKGANELGQIDLRFTAIQLLVLLGYNKKSVARAPHEVEDVTEMRRERPQVAKLLSWKTIMRITGKVQSIPRRLEGSNVRMWIEHGDLLHTDAGGMAIIYYKDRPAFTAIYNNFKMSWEIAMTDAAGQGVLLLDLLPGATSVYSLMRGVNEMGRLTCVTSDRLVIDPSPGACLGRAPAIEHAPSPFPLTPLSMTEVPSTIDEPSLAPFYTITVDEVAGRMFLVQRFRTSRKQRLLGEALFFKTKKRLFEPQRRILEARLLLPDHHEDQVILGALFAGLLQLERETSS